MTISVTVLGSSGMFATTERACAGYLVSGGGATLWMDAGAGTWRHLLQHVDYRRLDAIVLTHRHPDHTSDVFQAFHAREFGGPEPMEPIPVWAPEETIARLLGYSGEIQRSFDLRPASDGRRIEVSDLRLSFVRMAHPPETLGVRVECDRAVCAYSSDTGPEADFERLARNAHLFICEATFQDSDELWEGHMSASQAGAIAADVGATGLVLSHLPPGKDAGLSLAQAQKSGAGVDIQLAADGLTFEVTR